MKAFCIVFIISAWAYFLVWMHRRIENKGMKLGIPVLTLAALFFCCMLIRIIPTHFIWIPAILLCGAFGICLYKALTDMKNDITQRRIIFAAGCIVTATTLMFVDARITARNSRPVNPNPEKLTDISDLVFADPVFSPDGIAADDSMLKIMNKDFSDFKINDTNIEGDIENNTIAVQPYKLSDGEKNVYVTFGEDLSLWLIKRKYNSDTKNGLFTCSVRNAQAEIICADINFTFLYPEERKICSVSATQFADGSCLVSVHPIRVGSACIVISSPQSRISKFILVNVVDEEEE